MEYNFRDIERKWQQKWAEQKTYKAGTDPDLPTYYVLDMFPYPSGAGLHVGHPLGYIAADIVARYKRLKGLNVLHPMGYDSFGLPAEQYAIQTGQHPAVTTEQNIARYREQLDRLGFSFDWSREVRTSDPSYYKWTQWIFLQLFDAWYNQDADKAEPIATLQALFEQHGNAPVRAACDADTPSFSASEWNNWSEAEKQNILLNYRIAYLSESVVNWCPALGTVLANDEVKDGVSERGGHPVEQRKMMQWSMRITAYAQRLLDGLDTIDWNEAIKEVQRNWIGRSEGAHVSFDVIEHDAQIEVFSTRPDTVFGVSFLVVAPEHELVTRLTTAEQQSEVESYVEQTNRKSERERLMEKTVSGAFTGAYAKHPLTEAPIPIWISDYVLAGYGTGAIMAVPAGDERDWKFAKHFDLPIPAIFENMDPDAGAIESKEAKLTHSESLNGLAASEAIPKITQILEERGIGTRHLNYKLRDAVFGRQRYWGEPIPIYYKDGVPYPVNEAHLPLELPEIDQYKPTEDGEPPLARAQRWQYDPEKGIVANGEGYPLELTTMPGWAGSSWYYLRYLDPKNSEVFASHDAIDQWGQVDLYMGGAEHGTGHLLYVRFWTQFLFDRGYIPFTEPAQKLINQGMIQGQSKFVFLHKESGIFYSAGLVKDPELFQKLHVDVSLVQGDQLDTEAFRQWREEYADAHFELEDGRYYCTTEVEKMSKSKYNVVNPDDICESHGADALRLHEMFLGPVEMHKPWNTKGIDGVSKFLRKLWRLYMGTDGKNLIVDEEPQAGEYKSLHQCIKRVEEDLDRYSFNTCVSQFMVCVNELTDQKCHKRAILEPLAVLISCHAPHIAEELWEILGNKQSVTQAKFPQWEKRHLLQDTYEYPVSFNGKMRFKAAFSSEWSPQQVEAAIREHEQTAHYLAGKPVKKIIVVPKRIINIVV